MGNLAKGNENERLNHLGLKKTKYMKGIFMQSIWYQYTHFLLTVPGRRQVKETDRSSSCHHFSNHWTVTTTETHPTIFLAEQHIWLLYLERRPSRFSPSIIIFSYWLPGKQISIIYTTYKCNVKIYQYLRLSQEHGRHVNMVCSLFIVSVLSALHLSQQINLLFLINEALLRLKRF